MSRRLRELPIPPTAYKDPKSLEVVTAWVADGGLHCSIEAGVPWPAGEEFTWGVLISDIARHYADAKYKLDGTPREHTLATIQQVFNQELDERPINPDVDGGLVE